MEENLIGYLLESLDPDAHREVSDRLAAHPEERAKLDLLREALDPLALDREEFEPPHDLVLRTIGSVAEYIVNNEGSVAEPGVSPVADYLRSIGRREPAPLKIPLTAPMPVLPAYPRQESEANPIQHSRRNIFAAAGLSIAVLMIGVAAVVTVRQTHEVQACANNMRVVYQGLSTYSDNNDDRFPQVGANEEVRSAIEKMQGAGTLPTNLALTCPGTEHAALPLKTSNGVIDYAYSLGYKDDKGQLWGLTRSGENDLFPILADAPERRDGIAIPVNHRKGQNVLFAGGHVRFCTNPYVGPSNGDRGDDIYFNTANEAHAGTHRWDSVLGRANEQP